MGFKNWYKKGTKTFHHLTTPEVRIDNFTIGINSYLEDRYFKNKDYALIGFDPETKNLYIKPTDNEKEGFKLQSTSGNFRKISCNKFIAKYRLNNPIEKFVAYQEMVFSTEDYLIVQKVQEFPLFM